MARALAARRSAADGCPACGASVPKASSFCPSCGAGVGPVLMADVETNSFDDGTDVSFGGGTGSRRGRGALVGLLTLALLVGAAAWVGRSGGRDEVTADSTTSTTDVDSETTGATSSTTAAPTTTTSFPEWLPTVDNSAAKSVGAGVEVWFSGTVVLSEENGSSTGVFRYDVGNGNLDRLAPESPSINPPFNDSIVTNEGLRYQGERGLVRLSRSGAAEIAPIGEASFVAPWAASVMDESGIWKHRFSSSGNDGGSLRRFGFDGSERMRVDLPRGGGVMVVGTGRAAIMALDGRHFMFDALSQDITPTVGAVAALASKSPAYVATVCDEMLECRFVHVDGEGEVRPFEGEPTTFGWGGGSMGMSPDGSWVWLAGRMDPSSGEGEDLRAVNPLTGETVELLAGRIPNESGFLRSSVHWSADGWLVFRTDAGFGLWRPGLAAPIILTMGKAVRDVSVLAIGSVPTT